MEESAWSDPCVLLGSKRARFEESEHTHTLALQVLLGGDRRGAPQPGIYVMPRGIISAFVLHHLLRRCRGGAQVAVAGLTRGQWSAA